MWLAPVWFPSKKHLKFWMLMNLMSSKEFSRAHFNYRDQIKRFTRPSRLKTLLQVFPESIHESSMISSCEKEFLTNRNHMMFIHSFIHSSSILNFNEWKKKVVASRRNVGKDSHYSRMSSWRNQSSWSWRSFLPTSSPLFGSLKT